MPDKQSRYRQRTLDKGFQRVEVLIPESSVALLKAYARALRDAQTLGLQPPLFDGMRLMRPADTEGAQPAARMETFSPVPQKRHRNAAKERPDFSDGLIANPRKA